ncbi:hypothetical protein FIBSPDRAFT_859555 [Athelia psychrophila]|uniref:Uncharacterized protein n=1 Tax=Athelia psychrophila TaxID=1759441 RepID=A0A166L2J1_9AGAM|nr:hypothetical protein FIBSPDRAFT_859555 [Fibularhizoctonia sp. CBS 109695]
MLRKTRAGVRSTRSSVFSTDSSLPVVIEQRIEPLAQPKFACLFLVYATPVLDAVRANGVLVGA